MKSRCLLLRHLFSFAKHLGRSGEVETAIPLQLPQRRQHEVSAIDVCVHRREAIGKTFRDKTLRREVIAFVKLVLRDYVKDAGIALEARRVERQSIKQVRDSREMAPRIFQSHATNQAMNFIAQGQEQFRQIAAILTADTRDQCTFHNLKPNPEPLAMSFFSFGFDEEVFGSLAQK